MKTNYTFTGVESPHEITIETDREFYLLLLFAMLTGLKDAGILTQMQCRRTQQLLCARYHIDLRTIFGTDA